jgi:hypothetical protein
MIKLKNILNETASKEAMGIAGFTGTRAIAVQRFIDDFNLNAKKLFNFIAKVKLKDSQIVTITKQKSDLQQLVTIKTSEVQSKNSLLSQKEQLLVQKEQLLSELRIREENQLKEEIFRMIFCSKM